jgi:hypothetical protein
MVMSSTSLAQDRPLASELPKIWIGYALAAVTFAGEAYSAWKHPEMATGFTLPPLAIYLPAFVGGVYWLVCVREYHVLLRKVPGWTHPISPNKAVWFHLIPIYNFIWVFQWPDAIAYFVNQKIKANPPMRGWLVGAGVLVSGLCRAFIDPALGLFLLFSTCTYISRHLKNALEAPAGK